ncbi:mitochondrial carrier protein, putative, partial [Bodo saltans]
MDTVSESQEKLITQFLVELRQHYTDAATGAVQLPRPWSIVDDIDVRILAYKFLTARKWKISDALKMATSTATWRAEHRIDSLSLFPPAFRAYGYDFNDVAERLGEDIIGPKRADVHNDWFGTAGRIIEPVYKSGFQYWDKTGHPVLVMFFGQCNVRGLFKKFQQLASVGEKPTHAAVKYHTFENEIAAALTKYRDAVNRALPEGHPDKVDRRILGVTCIIDCGGLSYGHLWNPILDILKSEFAIDAAHYPEGLHRVIVTNCPTMIKFAYTIVKSALDPRVQQKITFCSAGKETEETMRLIMDVAYLPKFLGGEWVCPDGSYWGADVDADGAANGGDDGNSDAVTEDINVCAGKTHIKEYLLSQGEEVSWEFASTTGHDIRFQARFFSSTSANYSPQLCTDTNANDRKLDDGFLVFEQKLKDGADRFVATGTGVLRLTWDNTSSWFKGKKVQMRIIKSA